MDTIELTSEFDTPREEILKLATHALKSGEVLIIDIPIEGELFFTDSEELSSEFLYAAYIGESIAGACSSFECEADFGSVEFSVIPADAEEFTSSLWDSITGFLSESLLEEEGMDEISAAESRGMGEGLIDSPELVRHTQKVIDLAREVLDMSEDDEDDEGEGEDDEENENEDGEDDDKHQSSK